MNAVFRLLRSYREALPWFSAFLPLHLAIRAITAAVLAPLTAGLMALGLAASGRPALSDQEIALFLLTPVGALAGLAAASVATAAAVLDLAAMSALVRGGRLSGLSAAAAAIRVLVARFSRLVSFTARLILRVLLLIAPFAVGLALVYLTLLGDFDINYYLSVQPPAFVGAAALGGVIAVLCIGLLVWRLSGWAIALHLVMIADCPASDSFGQSAQQLAPYRKRVTVDVALWVVSRLALSSAAAAVAGLLMNTVIGLSGDALGILAIGALTVLVFWWLIDAVCSALANAALAVHLNRLYEEVTGDVPAPTRLEPSADETRKAALPLGAAVLVSAVIVAGVSYGADTLVTQADAMRPVSIIAHRGAAAARPENTVAAIRKAVEDRADWVEIDVQETADGVVIVAHDSDFMKQAGNPLKVWDATADDLAEIDIGSWFSPDYADQRPIPLEAALEAVRGRSKLLIELKYYGHDTALEQRVAETVEAADMVEEVAIMSLKYEGVEKFAALRPDWPRGVLSARAIGDLTRLDVDFVAVNAGQASLGLIRRAHERGKEVYVWTVNDALAMTRLASMGVDGLITDEPALARSVMASREALGGTERLALWIADRFRIGAFALVVDEGDA